MKTNTVRIAALAGSVALGLTGCAGDTRAADSKHTGPAGSVATSAPSPTTARPASTTPPRQSAKRASEEAAAIAVVREYVAEYNKALQSGNTTAFRATFKESCALCLGNASKIDEIFRNHQRVKGYRVALTSPLVTLHESRLIFVEGQLSHTGGQVVSASGAVVESFKPKAAFRFLWRVRPGASPVIFGSENR